MYIRPWLWQIQALSWCGSILQPCTAWQGLSTCLPLPTLLSPYEQLSTGPRGTACAWGLHLHLHLHSYHQPIWITSLQQCSIASCSRSVWSAEAPSVSPWTCISLLCKISRRHLLRCPFCSQPVRRAQKAREAAKCWAERSALGTACCHGSCPWCCGPAQSTCACRACFQLLGVGVISVVSEPTDRLDNETPVALS